MENNKIEMKITQAIKYIKEYRSALITNVVTGKIDVRALKMIKPKQETPNEQ